MFLMIIKGTLLLSTIGPGIAGNIFVFVNYMCIFFWDTKKKSTHLILIHLAFTNIIILFSKVTLKTIEIFGLRNFPDDTGCKTFVYLERVARGLLICTTSLLTVVQATTISPRASVRASFKPASTCRTLSFFLFLWILNSLLSMNLLYYMKNVSSLNSSQFGQSGRYCYFLPVGQTVRWMFLILMVLQDFLFLALMVWASVYMVLILHKHHKNARYLQKPKVLYHIPPEIQAAHSVLLLMLCFLFFYWIDYIISLHSQSLVEKKFIMLIIVEILTVGYAIVSPFVLIHRDGRLAECWHFH
ncbi:putative vomeronasal receptor-like protein 4 [Ursus maritimus]|uniref:Vomeronasal type-1 receptor n=1 Tax=Ursus maritimus TaxID=29073 RepID=A0A384CA79_URSMA|nr:putative vomeronasal receptor-like protein 4 [Ursus maritimus]